MSDKGAPKVSGPGLAACCAAAADREILSTAAPNAPRQHDDRLPHSYPRDSMIKGCLFAARWSRVWCCCCCTSESCTKSVIAGASVSCT